MTGRERFLAVMNYGEADRCFFVGAWAWGWPETIERWKAEGYDQDHPPRFDCDWWDWRGGWFFPNPPFERKVIGEDARTITYVNHEGILMRERKDQPYSSMPQFLRFPVQTREDFRRFWRERLQPDMAARLGADWVRMLEGLRRREVPLVVISDRWGGFFGPLRNLVGVERLCTLFYDEPAFVEEMMDATADFIIAMMGRILDHTDVGLRLLGGHGLQDGAADRPADGPSPHAAALPAGGGVRARPRRAVRGAGQRRRHQLADSRLA